MRLRPTASDPQRSDPAAPAKPSDFRTRAAGTPFGSWSATRWQYTSVVRPELQVDVVCDLQGTITLSLSEETYVLTWNLGSGSRSVGGTVTLDGDRLTLLPHGAAEPDVVAFRVASDTLALSAEASAWDLDGDGRDETAAFVAVLVRL